MDPPPAILQHLRDLGIREKDVNQILQDPLKLQSMLPGMMASLEKSILKEPSGLAGTEEGMIAELQTAKKSYEENKNKPPGPMPLIPAAILIRNLERQRDEADEKGQKQDEFQLRKTIAGDRKVCSIAELHELQRSKLYSKRAGNEASQLTFEFFS